MIPPLSTLTVTSARALLEAGEVSSEELLRACHARIEERNPHLNAYLEVFDDAVASARVIDERRTRGEMLSPLAGIPIAVKDNILIQGKYASSASRMLENYRASYDATVIEKLREAGALFVGRTNMDEFAMGGSTENSAFGPTKNPYDEGRVAGGSSGGSAAAVADGLALLALGSDTGGSIRQPASFCGVVGLKPSYGRISRFGLMAMASSLDQIGPFAKTVEDAELLFTTIAGPDTRDATSVTRAETPHTQAPYTVGVPRKLLASGVHPAVMDIFEKNLETLHASGCRVVDVELPAVHHSLAVYYVLMPAEVSTNLARFDGIRYGLYKEGVDLLDDYITTRGAGFGREVKRRIMLGTYVLSSGYYDAYYAKACAVRRVIRKNFDDAFTAVDVIALPTAPTPAFALGEKTSDPLQMYLEDIFTVPANITELPAISVPAGRSATGLPIGVQFIAPYFEEQRLFGVAKLIEHNGNTLLSSL